MRKEKILRYRTLIAATKAFVLEKHAKAEDAVPDNEELSVISALLGTIHWKKGSIGARLGALMEDIYGAEKESGETADFQYDNVLALVEAAGQRIPHDVEFPEEKKE